MEYGGITPIGLPESWPILIDRRVVETEIVVIGSGVRRSKLLVPGHVLSLVRGATIVDGLGRDAS
jgi:prolyl-tRNA editing enzyme YbaK/EbsC (Cys-tRNA(Pro) deacylase)